ncbi:MAG: hypothetical protein HOK28_08610, partial [Deltaproteobacteria bacterium]|nr:hypothetical protein [Deltaproteobacteria bacterium]
MLPIQPQLHSPASMGILTRLITGSAVSLLIFILVTRLLVLSIFPNSAVIDEWLASDLFFHFHSSVDVWFIWIAFDLPILIATPLVLFLGKRFFFSREHGRIGLKGPAVAMAWLFMVAHHFLFDVQPMFAAATFPLLPLTQPMFWKSWKRPPLSIAFASAIAACIFVISEETSHLASALCVFLIVTLALGGRIIPRWIQPRLQWLLVTGLIVATQLLWSLIPLTQTPDHATKIDNHRAYSFCESADGSSIYAAVTACYLHDSRYLVSEDCKREHIAQFETQTLKLLNRHDLSTDDYYGRMEFVRCIENTLYVGGSDMTQNGKNLLDSALAMPMNDPEAVIRNIIPAGNGHRSAFDPKRNALYFSGEFNDTITRLDRETGAQDPNIATWYNHPMLVLFFFPIQGSLAFAPESYHPTRDALFAGEVFGDAAYGFNLEHHTLLKKYQSTGGIIELTVDPERDRLYAANMWGLDVFDLGTGERIKRIKLGTVNRHPIIDKKQNLIYVPSTVSGRLNILDRDTFKVLGSIHAGYGLRYGLITQNGKQLVLSSNSGTYSFDTAELARRV